jgi:hypothetical protein
MTPVIAERFWGRVDKKYGQIPEVCPELGRCWPWTGATVEDGYGLVGHSGRSHRVAWELTNGEIPEGVHILHHCDNPPCCRPSHLFKGTNHDNVLDRHRKGRSKNLFSSSETHPAKVRRGENHWFAKLSSADVLKIRAMCKSGLSQTYVASCYSVHSATISRIVRHEWRKEVA